tara:strand:+ start:228 stop:452 length:225 start_codon:yes stop_codon:yes gene_type:complete
MTYFTITGETEREVNSKINKYQQKYGNSCFASSTFNASPIFEYQEYEGLSTINTDNNTRYFSLCSLETNLEQTF